MYRPVIVLVAGFILAGLALATGSILFVGGVLGGLVVGIAGHHPFRHTHPPQEQHHTEQLMAILITMGDALQETSPPALQQRGGWNQSLFNDVLAHIERQAPSFQRALIAYLAQPAPLNKSCVTALLAVDRLSAAYTYWTRLFPPRQSDESMFVLSLLQDLSEKVELAIVRLDDQLA